MNKAVTQLCSKLYGGLCGLWLTLIEIEKQAELLEFSSLQTLISLSLSQVSAESMESLCERQQRCVKASIVSSWQLVEAQDRLCGLELHSSESVEQARAQALASSAHLSETEEEWRRKESMLESRSNPVLGLDPEHGGFDKVHTHTRTHSSQLMKIHQVTKPSISLQLRIYKWFKVIFLPEVSLFKNVKQKSYI